MEISQIENQIHYMSDMELFDWLLYGDNALNPDKYRSQVPKGFEYVSGPKAINCIDFALGGRGITTLDSSGLVKGKNQEGKLILYYHGRFSRNYLHAGILIDGGNRVKSQW